MEANPGFRINDGQKDTWQRPVGLMAGAISAFGLERQSVPLYDDYNVDRQQPDWSRHALPPDGVE